MNKCKLKFTNGMNTTKRYNNLIYRKDCEVIALPKTLLVTYLQKYQDLNIYHYIESNIYGKFSAFGVINHLN